MVRRDQRSPRGIPPLDLARGAGVPSLPKSRKQASENGTDCRMRDGHVDPDITWPRAIHPQATRARPYHLSRH
jgi:hypothetical protein